VNGGTAIRRSPRTCASTRRTLVSAVRTASSATRAWRYSASPASVSARLRVVRRSKRTPSRVSSRCRRRPIVARGTRSSAAARVSEWLSTLRSRRRVQGVHGAPAGAFRSYERRPP
jgi:hypothetical protein